MPYSEAGKDLSTCAPAARSPAFARPAGAVCPAGGGAQRSGIRGGRCDAVQVRSVAV